MATNQVTSLEECRVHFPYIISGILRDEFGNLAPSDKTPVTIKVTSPFCQHFCQHSCQHFCQHLFQHFCKTLCPYWWPTVGSWSMVASRCPYGSAYRRILGHIHLRVLRETPKEGNPKGGVSQETRDTYPDYSPLSTRWNLRILRYTR